MRPTIITSMTGRTPITTNMTGRSQIDYLIQESLWKILLESWDWAILLERSINNFWEGRTPVTTILT